MKALSACGQVPYPELRPIAMAWDFDDGLEDCPACESRLFNRR